MDSKARHYIHIVIHLANLSTSYSNGKVALLCSSAQVYINMPTGSTQEAPEIRIPLYYRHTHVVPMVSTLEGLHCISLLGALSPTSEIG